MDRGLYIAASGMLAEMARQDLIANDLANVSTPGYKADRVSQRSFSEVMLSNTQSGQQIGPLGTGAAIARQVTDLTSAPLKDTGEPLEVVGKLLPLSPSGSSLPWAVENLRFCNWCEQLAQKDLNDCPHCGRRMAALERPRA